MESVGLNGEFWRGRRVLLTGHTGFKGAWAALWLNSLGAAVTGYALAAPTQPSLFDLAAIGPRLARSVEADIRDRERLSGVFQEAQPELVLHLAAQSLVHASYANPVGTYEVNVIGTVNVLEAARACGSVRAVIVVTSDKCYENRDPLHACAEADSLGGADPYSSSKACAEIVAAAYRASYFSAPGAARVATVRAGNVIGGGDFAADRLLPDIFRALRAGETVHIRNPGAVRPWQHVLEPIRGYLLLGQRLLETPGFAEAWNFGCDDDDMRPVSWVVERALAIWGTGQRWERDQGSRGSEAHILRLDSSKARARLGWRPRTTLDDALSWTMEWYRAHLGGADPLDATLRQIARYEQLQAIAR